MSRPAFKLLLLLISFSFFAIFPAKLAAAENFSTAYNVTYSTGEKGQTTVTQNVVIENLTSQYYVSQYKFTIGSSAPQKIKAWDQSGTLTPTVKRAEEETVITLKFKARVVGKGNRLSFGVSYVFPGLAAKNGLLWELNLLKLEGLRDIQSYTLTVVVPQSFGPLLYSSPSPLSKETSGGKHRIVFDKSRLLVGAPRLAFGTFQLYKLSLSYHLKNPGIGLGYTEIALPPDILGYQRISQLSLLPAPNSLRVDEDGNYLARYNLGPFERKDVVWEGYLALYYPPRSFTSQKISSIEESLIKSYTNADDYWETASVEVKAQAARLVDPKKSATQNAQAIYDFVSQTLSYDYEKLAAGELVRLGAQAALEQKATAVCMEYTDLFIALARAGGLPAREVNGYAYTADDTNRPLSLKIREGDVLHAWPQVYLPGTGWVMIDPTWASTSGSNYFSAFDLSHLTFVVKGLGSQYPLPAGSYKTEAGQKDVKVEFSQNTQVVEESPKLEVEIEFSRFAVSPFGSSAKVIVKNVGSATSFSSHLRVKTTILSPSPTQLEFGTLPPSSAVEKEIMLTPANALTRGEETLEVTVTGKDFAGEDLSFGQTATRTVRPFYLPLSYRETFAVLGAVALIFVGRKFLLTRLVR